MDKDLGFWKVMDGGSSNKFDLPAIKSKDSKSKTRGA